MNIAELLRKGDHNMKNAKFQRVWNAFKWRQTYQNSEFHLLELANGSTMKLKQISNGEMKGLGTGTLVWPAAVVLSKYLEKHFGSGEMQGKRVCDIGSGTGCTGFVTASLGATTVLTDQSCIMFLLEENRVLNCVENTVADPQLIQLKKYEWGRNDMDDELDFDYILVSDCVLPKLYPIEELVKAVDAVMAPHTIAYFSYEHRPFPEYDPRHEFERLAEKYSMVVKVIPLAEHDEVYSAEDIELWEVRRNSNNSNQLDIVSKQSSPPTLLVKNWGNVPLVRCTIDNIDVEITQEMEHRGIIGGVLWPCSVIVSRFLLKNSVSTLKELVGLPCVREDKAKPLVIDLGAGCGLVSMVLSYLGYNVIATDKASVIPLLQRNVDQFKGSSGSILVSKFDWGDSYNKDNDSLLLIEGKSPDVIVCSDCLYSAASVEPLLETLVKIANDATVIVLANELRSALEEFTYLARRIPNTTVDIKDIHITEPELEMFRGTTGRVSSPPIRLILMTIKRS